MRRYAWIYILVALMVGVWTVRYFTGDKIKTQTVYNAEYEYKISASGVVVRDESVISAGVSGEYEPSVTEGTRVISGQRVGVIYTDGIDSNIKQQLSVVNSKISSLENRSGESSDAQSPEAIVKQTAGELAYMSREGKVGDSDVLISELVSAVAYRSDKSKSPKEAALSELYAQKANLESAITSKNNAVYSNMAGLYFDEFDGFEQVLTKENVGAMSVSEFSSLNLKNSMQSCENAQSGAPVCRICYNGRWYFACVTSTDKLANIKNGSKVKIRIADKSSEEYDAEVYSISADEGGKCVLMVCCRDTVDDIFTQRLIDAEIVLESYKGFKIPSSSIRVNEDGEPVVYIDSSGIVRERKVDIIYKGDNFVIVDSSEQQGYLKLYDTLIVNGNDLQIGQLLERQR